MSSHKHFFDVLPNRQRSLLSVSKQLSSYSDRKSLAGGNSREKNSMIGLFGVKKKILKYRLESCVFSRTPVSPSTKHLGKSSSSAPRLLSYNISGSARLLVFDTLLDYRQLSAARTRVWKISPLADKVVQTIDSLGINIANSCIAEIRFNCADLWKRLGM